MSLVILLDAGPLSLVTNPKGSEESRLCKEWLAELVAADVRVMVPEGADYEVRREFSVPGVAADLTGWTSSPARPDICR